MQKILLLCIIMLNVIFETFKNFHGNKEYIQLKSSSRISQISLTNVLTKIFPYRFLRILKCICLLFFLFQIFYSKKRKSKTASLNPQHSSSIHLSLVNSFVQLFSSQQFPRIFNFKIYDKKMKKKCLLVLH